MDFRFTDEQVEMAEGARAFLEGESPPQRLRTLIERPDEAVDLWPQIAALGLLGVMAPDSAGGLGLGPCEFVQIAEAAGRVNLPEPMIETAALVVPAVGACNFPGAADIVTGSRRVALAHRQNPFVRFADEAGDLLLMTRERTALVATDDVTLTPRESVDPLRPLFAAEPKSESGATLAEGREAELLYDLTRARGAVFAGAELIGLAEGMIAQATAHASERRQFGVPIGSFQAVKHNLASALVEVEFAKPVVYRAAACLDRAADVRDRAAVQAKRAAAEAAVFAAEAAIQVHGAMGYTYESDLHFWMKRVWALAGLWGDRAACDKFIEDELLAGAIPVGPGASFDSFPTGSL